MKHSKKWWIIKGILLVIILFISYWLIKILGWKVGMGVIVVMFVCGIVERVLDEPKEDYNEDDTVDKWW